MKWNPFSTNLSISGIYVEKRIEFLCWRIESLLLDGGYGLITGDPGTGKSIILRILADRLSQMNDVTLGIISRPQSNISDFYREMGEIFGVSLKANNRWGGYRDLRNKWSEYLKSNILRPVLLIDEAQEMPTEVLNEIRLMSSSDLDSKVILAIVLCGDSRLLTKLRQPQLLPLGSRIRINHTQESLPKEDLQTMLKNLLTLAGAPSLFTPELIRILADQSSGNYRSLTILADTVLQEGFKKEVSQLTEQHYFEIFYPHKTKRKK